jgi:AcrR family transcriptional regulator
MDKPADPTKERILSYTEHRLVTDGIVRLSVDDLAADLGISKKTFYKVFPSKNAMLEELVDRIVGEVGGRIEAIAMGPHTFIEKIQEMMRFFGSAYRKLAIPLSEDVYRHMPHIWDRVEQFRHEKIQKTFTLLIEQGINEGYVRSDLNRQVFLLAYNAAIRTIIRPNVLSELPLTAPDVMEQLVSIFFGGTMTPKGRQAFGEIPLRKQSPST